MCSAGPVAFENNGDRQVRFHLINKQATGNVAILESDVQSRTTRAHRRGLSVRAVTALGAIVYAGNQRTFTGQVSRVVRGYGPWVTQTLPSVHPLPPPTPTPTPPAPPAGRVSGMSGGSTFLQTGFRNEPPGCALCSDFFFFCFFCFFFFFIYFAHKSQGFSEGRRAITFLGESAAPHIGRVRAARVRPQIASCPPPPQYTGLWTVHDDEPRAGRAQQTPGPDVGCRTTC